MRVVATLLALVLLAPSLAVAADPSASETAEVFPEAPYPNGTAIGVNWLAGFDFEIKVIARIPS